MTTPTLLRLDEVAEILRIGRTKTYELAQSGQLPGAIKVGGQWRVRRREFLAWVGEPAEVAS